MPNILRKFNFLSNADVIQKSSVSSSGQKCKGDFDLRGVDSTKSPSDEQDMISKEIMTTNDNVAISVWNKNRL